MIKKVREMDEAIRLRKAGFTYRQIQEMVPVSKSSLSEYLSKLELSGEEKKVLSKNQKGLMIRGRVNATLANMRRKQKKEENILRIAQAMYERFEGDQGFHVGLALYWAEGAKRSESFSFINTDEEMVKYMCEWCHKYLLVSKEQLYLRLYVAEKFMDAGYEEAWAKILKVPLAQFKKSSYTKADKQLKKGDKYKGCVRIELGPTRYQLIMKSWLEMQRKMLAHQAKQST